MGTVPRYPVGFHGFRLRKLNLCDGAWGLRANLITLRASCGAVYCNRSCLFVGVCVFVFVCGWVCYHDESKLRASILTKLGL